MKPHPRIRRTIKWGGATATLLLTSAWIASAWWDPIILDGSPHAIELFQGRVFLTLDDDPLRLRGTTLGTAPGLIKGGDRPTLNVGPYGLELWFGCEHYRGFHSTLAIPGWAFAAASLCISLAAWRLDTLARRRARLNLCPNCHYDRTGLAPASPCPECGTPTTS